MKRLSWPILVAALIAIAPAPSRAGYELVVNGGFETGNFTGWSTGPGNFVNQGYGLDGGFGVKYGSLGAASPLYQTIVTTPGAFYTFSFWQETRGGKPNEFQAYWNGGLILDLIDSPIAQIFTQYSFTEVATKSATEIRFGLRQDPSYSAMDQVSVQLAGTVPEPSSLLMVATAAALGGAVARRSSPRDLNVSAPGRRLPPASAR